MTLANLMRYSLLLMVGSCTVLVIYVGNIKKTLTVITSTPEGAGKKSRQVIERPARIAPRKKIP